MDIGLFAVKRVCKELSKGNKAGYKLNMNNDERHVTKRRKKYTT